MPIAHCPLPIAHCPLPIAHCPLPIAHCPTTNQQPTTNKTANFDSLSFDEGNGATENYEGYYSE
ncbi:hypothetical protein [Tolypothrix sp. VBCCA 56010]|uniref:hypothetical protein n=1 Tax=Tolypothrix sp. VBCCA 56010 TaxID=3137731 RepID=UPI003D7DE4AE